MHRVSRLVLLCAALSFGTHACSRKEPCAGLEVGDRIRVDILEPYTEDSTFAYERPPMTFEQSCGADFDVWAGDFVEFTITLQDDSDPGDVCIQNWATVDRPRPFAFIGDAGSMQMGDNNDGVVLDAAEGVQVDATCSGSWIWVLVNRKGGAESANAFATPSPGQVPDVRLYRVFTKAGGSTNCTALLGTNSRCGDVFVVQARPL